MSQFPGGSSEEVGKAHVTVGADTTPLKEGMKDVREESEKTTKEVNSTFGNINRGAEEAGRKISGATRGINRLRSALTQVRAVALAAAAAIAAITNAVLDYIEKRREQIRVEREVGIEVQNTTAAILRQIEGEDEQAARRRSALDQIAQQEARIIELVETRQITEQRGEELFARLSESRARVMRALIETESRERRQAIEEEMSLRRQADQEAADALNKRVADAIESAETFSDRALTQAQRVERDAASVLSRLREELQDQDISFEARDRLRELVREVERVRDAEIDAIREAEAERERAAQERHERELERIEERRQREIQSLRDQERERFSSLNIQAGGAEELNQILSEVQNISRRAAVQTSATGPTI